jgi:hypothetical protein
MIRIDTALIDLIGDLQFVQSTLARTNDAKERDGNKELVRICCNVMKISVRR